MNKKLYSITTPNCCLIYNILEKIIHAELCTQTGILCNQIGNCISMYVFSSVNGFSCKRLLLQLLECFCKKYNHEKLKLVKCIIFNLIRVELVSNFSYI